MRYIAHTNGASLVFASVREKTRQNAMIITHVVEGSTALDPQVNYDKAICVPATCD